MPINITDKIYVIRGQKVMLDADLAEIYGYETKYLNRQVRRNAEKFEGEEFMFQLTKEELKKTVKCHFGTSRDLKYFEGQNGGVRKLPYAFTEQGVYMLMTVLKGELAIKQSRMLVMAFKAMKDYIIENKMLLDRRENLNIGYKVSENTEKIKKIDARVTKLANEMNEVVKRAEISPVFLDFKTERPDLTITFIKTGGRIHDRFIILDEKKAYSAGGSSKDAGNKMTSIQEITEKFVLNSLFVEIEKLKKNGLLKLK